MALSRPATPRPPQGRQLDGRENRKHRSLQVSSRPGGETLQRPLRTNRRFSGAPRFEPFFEPFWLAGLPAKAACNSERIDWLVGANAKPFSNLPHHKPPERQGRAACERSKVGRHPSLHPLRLLSVGAQNRPRHRLPHPRSRPRRSATNEVTAPTRVDRRERAEPRPGDRWHRRAWGRRILGSHPSPIGFHVVRLDNDAR